MATPDDLTTRCLAEVERAMDWRDLVPMLVERNQQGRTFPRVEDEARWLAYSLQSLLASRLARMLAAMRADCSLCAGKGSATIGWGPNAVAGQCWYCDKVLRAVAAAREAK